MGLTDWKPALRVRVNGRDRTGVFSPRVSSVTLTDVDGIQSDTCEIILTDHNPLAPLEIPDAGAEIEIGMGYLMAVQIMGVYIADEVEISGPPWSMRITGYAAAHGDSDQGKSPLTTSKSRSWPEKTKVGAMVEKIAGEAGFKAAVSQAAAEVELPHIDQMDESDLNLLTRVSRDAGLIFKPAGGSLIVYQQGEAASASGAALPTVALGKRDLSQVSMRIARRAAYGKVVASYQDFGAAKPVDVEVDATPQGVAGVAQVKRLKGTYPTEAAARAAAEAEARRGKAAARTLTISLPGRADLMAGGKVSLSGVRAGIDGEWVTTRVTHQMGSGGWQSGLEATAAE